MSSDSDASTKRAVAHIGRYPGTPPGPGGTLVLETKRDSLSIFGILTGLTPSSTGGWHVHVGFTCEDSDSVGGHYKLESGADPWTAIKYTSDADGVAIISATVAGFSLTDAMAVLGRAVVVHDLDSSPSRKGCGVIVPSNAQIVTIGSCARARGSK